MWKEYLKNNKHFFRKLKGMDSVHKGYGKFEKYLEKSGKFFCQKKNGNPDTCNREVSVMYPCTMLTCILVREQFAVDRNKLVGESEECNV